jgi:hypothetical protein
LRKTRSWKLTKAQAQGKPRTACAKSAAVGMTETAARFFLQDPEAAEATTRTGRERGLNLSLRTTIIATVADKVVDKVVVKVVATDRGTGCPPVLVTDVVEAAVAKAGDHESSVWESSTRSERFWPHAGTHMILRR